MNILQVNFESRESILNDFDKIANKFLNNVCIKINQSYYRITDFEFYPYSDNFPDPQTHKNKLQLENSKFYLHSSGIDITFGDGVNYGGILLRGIVKLFDGAKKESGFSKEQFDGPQIVATELFSNLNPLGGNGLNEIALIEIDNQNEETFFAPGKLCLKTKRIGLTPKIQDKEHYYMNLSLRYIIVLQGFPQFKQKIKGIENLLLEEIKNGRLKEDEANDILGYKKIF
jgi:hypothetical protein